MTYNEVATYQRDYDEFADGGLCYGINWIDGEEIIGAEWFKTEEERELRIDAVMGFQAEYRTKNAVDVKEYNGRTYYVLGDERGKS